MRTFPPRICPNCGKSFEPNWNTRRYCSDACVKEHQKIAANLRKLHGTKSDRAQRRALMARKIESLQAYIDEMNPKVDKLMTVNGELCAEINRQERRIRELERDWKAACDSRARWQEKAADMEGRCIELETLLRDVYDAWCFECDPWADDFACAHFDGTECTVKKRYEELMEVCK